MSYFIAFIAGILLFNIFHFFPLLTIQIISLIFVYNLFKKRTIIVFLVLTGILYGYLRIERVFPVEEMTGKQLNIHFSVRDKVSDYPTFLSSHLYRGVISSIDSPDSIKGLKGKEAYLISNVELERGEIYKLIVTVLDTRGRKIPGSYHEKAITLKMVQELGSSTATHENLLIKIQKGINRKREELDRYLKGESENSGAFLSSIITGQRSGLNDEVRDSFSRTGLAHILSISGTHFGLLSTFLFFVIRFSISLLPHPILRRLTIYLTPAQLSAFLSLPFLILYLLISGASLPAIRSFIMINIFLFGLLTNRKGYWLNSLLFAASLILLWEPSSINDISFQLSFIAVLFLGYSVKGINNSESGYGGEAARGFFKSIFNPRKHQEILGRLLTKLRIAFTMSLFVSMGTAPIVAYYFHYLSIISPFVNIILTPLICLIVLPFALLSSFIFILTGYLPLKGLLLSLTDLAILSVKSLSSLPFSAILIRDIPMGFIFIFYVIVITFILISCSPSSIKITGRLKFLLFLCITQLSLVFLPGILNKDLSLTFLDVGQGDCIVIETPKGKTFLVDTGKTGREAESYLRFRGKDYIDSIILTHADNDHSGGLGRLLRKLRVGEIWDNGLLLYTDNIKTPIKRLSRGDVIESDGLEIFVLHPYNGFYASSERGGNEYSLVLRIRSKKDASLLLTGDIEEEAEEDLLHLGRWLSSNAIKISHHGSRHSSSEAFLHAVSPEIAIISVGRENPFSHPHEETMERLGNIGTKIFRTDRDGAIKLTEGEKGFNVKTFNDYSLEKATGIKSELRNLRRLFQTW
ncbi:MAG: DNA internalization-related competence protein ComEC/Rec2 [Thermodesulfovibrionales bacterium]